MEMLEFVVYMYFSFLFGAGCGANVAAMGSRMSWATCKEVVRIVILLYIGNTTSQSTFATRVCRMGARFWWWTYAECT